MAVTIADVGVCKKKLTFEIPREDIQTKIDSTLDELTKTAQLPGFRPGHAPRRLVQRKLHDEINDQVKAELISEAYKAAVEELKIEVLREEEFDPAKVELPDEGPLTFELDVEVKPEIELPDTSEIALEVPRAETRDEDVTTALENLRRSRGRFVEQKKTVKAAERDMLAADVKVTVGDEVLLDQPDGALAVYPQAVAGIRMDRLADELKGKKAGDSVAFKVTVPEDHESEALRGQEADVSVTIKGIRRIEMPPLDDDFAKSVGMETAADVEKAVRDRLQGDLENSRETARREAMAQWILDKVPLEVPEGVAEANAGRVFNNQTVRLQQQGVPLQQIQERADELMTACRNRAQRDLKLAFIFAALAKQEKIEATEEELQARVGLIARNYGRATERMYEDLQKRGQLDALREQVLDDKVYQFLLAKATVTEVAPPEAPPEAAKEAPAEADKKEAKKTTKKTAAKKPTTKKAKPKEGPKAGKAPKAKAPKTAQKKTRARKPPTKH